MILIIVVGGVLLQLEITNIRGIMKYKIAYQVLEIKEDSQSFITAPDKLYEVVKERFSPIQEILTIIGLNIKNKVLFVKDVAIGSHNRLMITPKDIFTHLLLNNCINYVVAHNHPSSDLSPSSEDVIFTKRILKAGEIMGITLLDHLVYNNTEYVSMHGQGLI